MLNREGAKVAKGAFVVIGDVIIEMNVEHRTSNTQRRMKNRVKRVKSLIDSCCYFLTSMCNGYLTALLIMYREGAKCAKVFFVGFVVILEEEPQDQNTPSPDGQLLLQVVYHSLDAMPIFH